MKKDGGTAFPYIATVAGSRGMSLRDYFAATALQGLISRIGAGRPDSETIERDGTKSGKTAAIDFSEAAYQYADAMLAERDK